MLLRPISANLKHSVGVYRFWGQMCWWGPIIEVETRGDRDDRISADPNNHDETRRALSWLGTYCPNRSSGV